MKSFRYLGHALLVGYVGKFVVWEPIDVRWTDRRTYGQRAQFPGALYATETPLEFDNFLNSNLLHIFKDLNRPVLRSYALTLYALAH